MSAVETVRVGFIGCGRMATAIAQGLIRAGFVSESHVTGSDPSASMRDAFTNATGSPVVAENRVVVSGSDVIVLAVKPQHMASVLNEISGSVEARHLIVSVAAGVPLAMISAAFRAGTRVIRVMPNTPCLVGAGATAFARGPKATEADATLVERLFSTIGIAIEVPEPLLDAVTGLSGSGPAYVFQVIEALSDGGVRCGLPRNISTRLAAQTVLGAAKMVLDTGEHPGSLKDGVTSPGGTTIAGLHQLERGALRGTLMNAVEAATTRSQELGRAANPGK
ncbi:Pyrroline-5-carboxylate reductase [Caulifigura coniformis]|uniref:Pyrroline-5-carboxylate reductase n=1 Tax=Caulifigura coniformis TaxID=2527983 RepID=A0A517SGR8_9PLAN|nr:pyrroline-5-carboxylate reductase [Caulifigura coniformis]QDT55328.1 Pyrroline-5-carboxylate reductase [Caulifigura coniformis]